MKDLEQLPLRLSNRNNFWLLLGLLIFFIVVIDFTSAPFSVPTFMKYTHGTKLLDMEINYSPEKAYQMLTDYGLTGRQLYLNILTMDLIFPLVYSLFLMITVTLLFQKLFSPDHPIQKLNLIPLVAGLADYLENFGIATMLLNYPTKYTWVAGVTNVFTITKDLSILASLILLIIATVGIGVKKANNCFN